MRVRQPLLLLISLSSEASVFASYLDYTPKFCGSSTRYCLDVQQPHPDCQSEGMSSRETAADDDGPQVVGQPHPVPKQTVGSTGNGVPLYTEERVPKRFLIGCEGDKKEATRRWKETYKWRKENKIDEIIDKPQPYFHQCREVFPVYLHGRSRKGMPVMWDLIGKVNLPRADELELDLALLTTYYVFINECIWRVVLDKGENDDDLAQFITVEDVKNVRPWHLTPRVLKVLRTLTGTMKAHNLERSRQRRLRCYKTYIINAPSAFTLLWRIVAPMLDSRTRDKISILGTNYLETMKEEIEISQIPPEYGGSSGRDIQDSDDERKIQYLVARLNARREVREEGQAPGIAESLP